MNLTVAQLTDLKLEGPRTWHASVPAPSARMTLTAVAISMVVHVAGLLVPIKEQTARPTPTAASRHELDLTLVSPAPPKAAPAPKREHAPATGASVATPSRVAIPPKPESPPRPEPRSVVTTIAHRGVPGVDEKHRHPRHHREAAKAAPAVPRAHTPRHRNNVSHHKANAAVHHTHTTQTVIRPETLATLKRNPLKPAPTDHTPVKPVPHHSPAAKAVSQPPVHTTPAATPKAVEQAQQKAFRQALTSWISNHRRYPRLARIRGWQGQALIQAQIARDGHLLRLTLEHSSGYPMLDREAMHLIRSALEAIPQPARDNGARTLSIPVTFHLTG